MLLCALLSSQAPLFHLTVVLTKSGGGHDAEPMMKEVYIKQTPQSIGKLAFVLVVVVVFYLEMEMVHMTLINGET